MIRHVVKITFPMSVEPTKQRSCFASGKWAAYYDVGEKTYPPVDGSLLFAYPLRGHFVEFFGPMVAWLAIADVAPSCVRARDDFSTDTDRWDEFWGTVGLLSTDNDGDNMAMCNWIQLVRRLNGEEVLYGKLTEKGIAMVEKEQTGG